MLFSKPTKISSINLPTDVIDLGSLDDLRTFNSSDLKKIESIRGSELTIKKDEFYFWCKKVAITSIFLIVASFFIASFSASMGWIDNPTLKAYFEEAVISLISGVVGLALGYLYSENKKT